MVSDESDSSQNLPPEQMDKILKVKARLAAADFDLMAFMELVVNEMEQLTLATGVVIELVDGEDMVYQAASGTVKEHIGMRLPMKESISGLCVTSHEVLISNDTEKDPRVNFNACKKVGACSLVVAPLFSQNKAVGVLKILSNKPHGFGPDDVKILQLMAGFLGIAIGRQLMDEIREFF